jgi:hypothetical protein
MSESFVLEFAASSSEAVVSRAFTCGVARYINVLNRGLPSRAFAGSFKQCLMYTNQYTTSMGSHSA